MSWPRIDRFSWLLAVLLVPGAAWSDFEPPVLSSAGGQYLLRHDVNSDGRDDLVAFSSGNQPVFRVLLSAGDGTFDESEALGGAEGRICDWEYPTLVDANDDGHLDIVAYSWMRHSPIRRVRWWGGWADVADYTLYQNLWPGNGDGTFAPLVVVAQVEYQQSPIPREDFKNLGGDGDFNRDGLEDYAQLTTEIGRRFRHIGPVIIGLNLGGGAFEERLFDIGTGEYGLITGDFDGDGWSDLALLRNNTLTVLINDHVW